MQRFQVVANRDHFTDAAAVIEFEDRYNAVRIDLAELRTELFAAAKINLHGFELDAFFSQVNADASRARCCFAIIKLQFNSPGTRQP